MKKIIKIVTAITILFLVMGIVTATDIDNLKCPNGWEAIGGGSYHGIGDSQGMGNGQNMMIMEYTPANCGDFFENVTDESYYVYQNDDNTYNFTDWEYGNEEGCFEVVEIDGKQYFLIFSENIDNEYDVSIYDVMMEFNELNNLKPIAV